MGQPISGLTLGLIVSGAVALVVVVTGVITAMVCRWLERSDAGDNSSKERVA